MELKTQVPENKGSFSSLLNQPVTLRKRAIRYPTKATMNLNVRANEERSLAKVLVGALIFLILAGALAKFGMLDRFERVRQAGMELQTYQQQLEALNAQLAGYQETREKYLRYTKSYRTKEEAALIDRMKLLNAIEDGAAGLVQITAITVSGGDATVTAAARELSLVADYMLVLQGSEYVQFARVYNANTADDAQTGEQYVTASIAIALGGEVSK